MNSNEWKIGQINLILFLKNWATVENHQMIRLELTWVLRISEREKLVKMRRRASTIPAEAKA